MSGASSRRYGHKWERDVANYLTEAWGFEVVTARSLSGGTTKGVDILTPEAELPLGFGIECKATKGSHKVTAWVRQARKQADLWVVLAKNPHKPVEDGEAYFPYKDLALTRCSIELWATQLAL